MQNKKDFIVIQNYFPRVRETHTIIQYDYDSKDILVVVSRLRRKLTFQEPNCLHFHEHRRFVMLGKKYLN